MLKKFALIGYSGFIGSNLINFNNKIDKFNSKNINKIKKKKYDLVICAGTYSKIWLAKKYPKKDKKNINTLIKSLNNLNTKIFVLISSCEVYGDKKITTEKQSLNNHKLNNYGKNRLYLENYCKKKFSCLHIIRLPIVYGKNFSKNFIFDLLNNNDISRLNGSDKVQIYNVKNLKKDINFVLKKKIPELNISSPPLSINYIAQKYFKKILNRKDKNRNMNMKTIYAKKSNYFVSKKATENDFKRFLKGN